jgi:F-type H+-transporting ATPase subunit delta
MITGSIARRYARALFSLAVEKRSVEAWNQSLETLAKAVEASPELKDVLQNPAYPREQRRAVVERVAAAMQLAPEPANLLFLMGDRNRLPALGGVVAAFRELADQELGRVRARVTSAVPLDDASVAAIAEKLSASTQKKVLVERVVDPAIIGGVVAQVGSLVYDGSLRTQLEDLHKSLKQ